MEIHNEYLGVKFKRPNKDYIETVINIYVTRNLNNSIVNVEYLTAHDFCGQRVTNLVPASIIQRYKLSENNDNSRT